MTELKAVEVLKELQAVAKVDPERAHSAADSLLLDFIASQGFSNVTQAYDKLIKSAAWWACA